MKTVKKPFTRAVDITFVGMFAALMAIGANIASWAPFLQIASVPLSMQSFFAIFSGLLLGSRLGATAMTVYMLIGIAGAPVFSGFQAGIGVIFSSTGGFILSFIATAYIAGKIIESTNEPKLLHFMIASFAGLIMNYLIGTNYMYIAFNTWLDINMSYGAAWLVMLWFAVKDIIFTVLGALIAPRIYHAVKRPIPNLNKSVKTHI